MAGPSQASRRARAQNRRSASPRFGRRHLAERRQFAHDGAAETSYGAKFVRLFGERLFVHIEPAIELDLNGMDSGGGPPVTNGGVPAAVRLVVREAELKARGDVLGRFDDGLGGGAALASAGHDVGALAAWIVVAVATAARHRVTGDDDHEAVPSQAVTDQHVELVVVGPIIAVQTALELRLRKRARDGGAVVGRGAPDQAVGAGAAGGAQHRVAIDVVLRAVQIADVAAHARAEQRGAGVGRVGVKLVDVQIGVATDGLGRRDQAGERLGVDLEPGVRHLDDYGHLGGAWLGYDERHLPFTILAAPVRSSAVDVQARGCAFR